MRKRENVTAREADPAVQFDAFLKALSDSAAAVFWVGNNKLSEDIIYRHLRGLGKITIDVDDDALFKTDSVTFRNADANVMAQLLPALDPPRHARLFGPATHILFAPHHEWVADCVVANNDTPAMNVTLARGTLHWDRTIRNAVFETRVAAHLKDVAPERLAALEPSAFSALLLRSTRRVDHVSFSRS